MHRFAITFMVFFLAGFIVAGCNLLSGNEAPAPAPIPAASPAPSAVPAAPGAVPAAPGAVPTVPVAPAAAPVAPAIPVAPTPTGDPLTDKINAKKFEIAPAWTATSALIKPTLEAGKSQAYQVSLPGPLYCHTYIATGGTGVSNLDIKIESPAGAVEANDATVDATPIIFNHCPTTPGPYKLTATMTAGTGEFAIQVFSKTK